MIRRRGNFLVAHWQELEGPSVQMINCFIPVKDLEYATRGFYILQENGLKNGMCCRTRSRGRDLYKSLDRTGGLEIANNFLKKRKQQRMARSR